MIAPRLIDWTHGAVARVIPNGRSFLGVTVTIGEFVLVKTGMERRRLERAVETLESEIQLKELAQAGGEYWWPENEQKLRGDLADARRALAQVEDVDIRQYHGSRVTVEWLWEPPDPFADDDPDGPGDPLLEEDV